MKRRRLNRLDLRRVALFVAVAGAVALVVVMAAREAGVGEVPATAATTETSAGDAEMAAAARVEASTTQSEKPQPPAQDESLTVTLTAAAICETEAGRGGFGERVRIDADGNRTYEHVALGLYGVAETPVKWAVTGGTGPYTLVIDGETRDATHEYTGAKGTASVSCALETGNVYFGPDTPGREVRRYRGKAVVDSGQKTIRAVATDAQGVTGETSVDIYVILVNPNVLKRGQTYRVWGRLFTAPLTHDLHASVYVENECDAASNQRCENEVGFAIIDSGVEANLLLWESDLVESHRWQILSDGTIIEGRNPQPAGAAGGDPVDRAFDAILDSKNRPPADGVGRQ